MKGFLASQGIREGQRQNAAAMPYANAAYHHQRQTDTARLLNPIPYSASYFGHKLHIDQNGVIDFAIVQGLLEDVLQEDFHFTSYNTVSYIQRGPGANAVQSGFRRVMLLNPCRGVSVDAKKGPESAASQSGWVGLHERRKL